MSGAGALRERVAFDAVSAIPDGRGGQSETWGQIYECAAEFRYQRGQEAGQAGGQTGTAVFKVRVRSTSLTRALTPADRMRDVRRGIGFNIREVDAITDRDFVWLIVESGVAL